MALDASTSATAVAASVRATAIDVHAHCVPAALLAEAKRSGQRHGVEIRGPVDQPHFSFRGRMTAELPAALVDPAPRIAAMDDAGVACQLLSPWMELTPHDLDPPDALWFARTYNDALAELVATSAGRFDAVGMVPIGDPQAAEAELRRAVAILGLAGVELPTSLDNVDLSTPQYEPFWRAAAGCQAFILLHPLQPLGASRYSTHRLGDIVGNPAESTAAVARLILSGLLRRLPELVLCAVHGGGFLPYLAGRLEAISALDGYPWPAGWVTEDLRRLYFDSLTHSDQALRWLIEFAGADHVMIGSDYPFATGCAAPAEPVERLALLTTLPLAKAERAALLHANAEQLLDAVSR